MSVLCVEIDKGLMKCPIKQSLRVFAELVLFAVLVFCIFGFVATLQPTAGPSLPWQIGFSLVGVISLGGIVVISCPHSN